MSTPSARAGAQRRPASRRAAGRIAAIVLLAVAPSCAPAPEPPADGPPLVLMLVVDQGRYDYLDRFASLWTGGFAWLLDNGAVFTDAHQNHANTSTAPGHAALSTGTEPYRSGIIGNSWYDRTTRSSVYSGGTSGDASPINLRTTTLGDWIKAADPRAKVFTASSKDRSAVLMAGASADAAYWYDGRTGSWRSGGHYEGWERDWLTALHERRLLDELHGTTWEPLTGEHAWTALSITEVDTGAFEHGFPYAFGGLALQPGPGFYRSIGSTPFVDAYLADLAKAMIEGEQLGADGVTDFLGLSFSAVDAVGHAYGPDSPEVLDTLCRLDVVLGELIEFLDARIGMENVLVAFSSDHGVVPLPEIRDMRGESGRRLAAADALCIQQAGARLRRELGEDPWFLNGLYLDRELIAERGLDLAAIQETLAAYLGACDAVRKAWTATEIAAIDPWTEDPVLRMLRNNYDPERSADLVLQFEPYFLAQGGFGTTHGSLYPYDSHVPMILAGPGIPSARIGERVATVDVAPTLAAHLSVTIPPDLDGRDLNALIQASRGRASGE